MFGLIKTTTKIEELGHLHLIVKELMVFMITVKFAVIGMCFKQHIIIFYFLEKIVTVSLPLASSSM